ncbi:MAG: copper amine oxidase [Paenibacillus sp.]|nr:copper amine oxidase [Paenibacillus sp.]
MNVKRLAALTIVLTAIGTGIAYASSPWGEFQGLPKVKVQMNNEELSYSDVPAVMIGNQVMVPLDSIASSLNAAVKWDDAAKIASIYRPNVHMFVAKDIAKDDSPKVPFGKVSKGNKLDFVVAVQVDSLATPIYSFKIELVSPDGAIIRSVVFLQDSKESFWYSWPLESVTFDAAGKYKVQFKIKLNEAQDYSLVSEKTIISE